MYRNKKLNLFILIIVLITLSCKKEDSLQKSDIPQKILFQYEYRNWAWGYQHGGWFIDSKRSIYGYNLPETWIETNSIGDISENDLMSNLNQYDTIFTYIIDQTDIVKYKNLISSAKEGELSEAVNTANDFGSPVLYCYTYDQENTMYTRVLLAMQGDFTQYNQHPDAIILTNWLIEIGEEINRLYWLD